MPKEEPLITPIQLSMIFASLYPAVSGLTREQADWIISNKTALFTNTQDIVQWLAAIKPELLLEFNLEEERYELFSFLRGAETTTPGFALLERAKSLRADCGEDDCQRFLKYQDQIPRGLRGKIQIVFTGCHREEPVYWISYISWDEKEQLWIRKNGSVKDLWYGSNFLVKHCPRV